MGKSNIREKLMETLYGIASKDAERVIISLIDLGALKPTGDMGPVRRSIQYMLDNSMDKPFEAQSITAISDDLYEVAYDQPFRFPATFTFVMRAFSTLEGVGKGLDPDFNFMEVAQPFALELVADLDGSTGNSIIDELTRQATQVSNTALSLPRRIDDTIEKLDRGDIRLRVRSVESDRLLRRLGMMQMATNYSVFVSALVICATLLFINGYIRIAIAAVMLGLVPAWALVRLLRRINR